MNPTELRALADALRPMAAAPCFDGINIDRAADYLHQQADQQSVGTLTISTFRGRAQNQNRDFDYTGGLPDGSYSLYTAPARAAPQAEKHPDDAAVDRFAAAMKSKLAEKRRQGKSGWDDPRCPTEYLAALLHEHVVKGDPLDVGNFAMMLWCRGGSTNETQAEPKRPIIEVSTELDTIYNRHNVILTVDGHRFFMDYNTEQLADAEDFAETLRKALGITGGSDAE